MSAVYWVLLALACASVLSLALTLATYALRRRVTRAHGLFPPVTVLKPLCGDEPDLAANLRSFCRQYYPRFEIVCGVHDANDPAYATAQRVRDEDRACAMTVVANARGSGSNPKVSNLINIFAHAHHDYLVLADSDIAVGPDFLRAITAPLADPRVGLVTCGYRARPQPGIWSRLGALHIDGWFLPAVLLAQALGDRTYVGGASIALRRETLARIGGFAALRDVLADDYRLGELVREAGLRTVLSPYVVTTTVDEPSLRALFRHELRWLRTIRAVRPAGHVGLSLSYSLTWCALLAALPPHRVGLTLFALAYVLRAAVCLAVRGSHVRVGDLALLFPRDVLSMAIWVLSFGARAVHWRTQRLGVDANGSLQRRSERC